jgi:glycosyl transferase family 25
MSEVAAGGRATDATPPIWIISLPSAVERRRVVVEGFEQLNIPFELVDGVDGNALSSAEWHRYSRRRSLLETGRPLARGELGCALSHLGLYERMQRESIPRAVVVEDDVVPTPDLLPVLRELDRVPDGWDVVTLHALFDIADPAPVGDEVVAGRYRVCRYRGPLFGAQCYVITLAAATRMLAVGRPVGLPADDLLFRRFPARLRVFGIEPNVVHLGAFDSEIVARSDRSGTERLRPTDRATVVLGKVRRRLRRLRHREAGALLG